MRLIDADALKENIDVYFADSYSLIDSVHERVDAMPTIEPDWTELMVICDNCGHAIHVKRTDAKPIIEPERKKGKWIMGKCDQCGAHAPFWPMASTYYESDFCPNCGCSMEGDPDVDE